MSDIIDTSLFVSKYGLTAPSKQGAEILGWIATLEARNYPNWFRPKKAVRPRLSADGEDLGERQWRPSGLLRALNWLSEDYQCSMLSALEGNVPWGLFSGLKLGEVFRRSSISPDIYFVDPYYEVEVMALAEVLSAGCFWSEASSSPVNASAFEYQAQLLDGGASHFSGSYFIGLKGTWIHGMRAVRLICHELGLPQPPKRRFEDSKPDVDNLWEELLANRLDPETFTSFETLGLVASAKVPTTNGGEG
jgi:hypothetical protein